MTEHPPQSEDGLTPEMSLSQTINNYRGYGQPEISNETLAEWRDRAAALEGERKRLKRAQKLLILAFSILGGGTAGEWWRRWMREVKPTLPREAFERGGPIWDEDGKSRAWKDFDTALRSVQEDEQPDEVLS